MGPGVGGEVEEDGGVGGEGRRGPAGRWLPEAAEEHHAVAVADREVSRAQLGLDAGDQDPSPPEA